MTDPTYIKRTSENFNRRAEILANQVFEEVKKRLPEERANRLRLDKDTIEYKPENQIDGGEDYKHIFYPREERKTYGRGKNGKMRLYFWRSQNSKKMYEKKVNIFEKLEEIVGHAIDSIDSRQREQDNKTRRHNRRNRTKKIMEPIREAGFDRYGGGRNGNNMLGIKSGGSYSAGFEIRSCTFDVGEDADMSKVVDKLEEIEQAYRELRDIVKG